jgi:hypothetical protein
MHLCTCLVGILGIFLRFYEWFFVESHETPMLYMARLCFIIQFSRLFVLLQNISGDKFGHDTIDWS